MSNRVEQFKHVAYVVPYPCVPKPKRLFTDRIVYCTATEHLVQISYKQATKTVEAIRDGKLETKRPV